VCWWVLVFLQLHCCGLQDYDDWEQNIYFNCSSPGVESCGVPFSCCQPDDDVRYMCIVYSNCICLQCFDAVGCAAGRASGLYKTEWWGAGVLICLERGADLHMVQLMPLPLTVYCFSKIQTGFTFLVPASPCIPGQRAVKQVCMCVCCLVP